MNFDSIYSEHIADSKIKYLLPNTFLLAKTNRYVIERKQLLEGLDKILKEFNNIVIISIKPNYDSRNLIATSKYKDIVIEIPSTNHRLNDTFFILDKKYLPKFECKDLSNEEIKKFKLNLLDDEYKLYSNVIDVNLLENNLLKEEFITNQDEELKVLILISFIFLIKWRKDRKIVMISLTSPFEERGIVNSIEELKPYDK